MLGRTAEALRAITGSKSAISLQRGPVDPKFLIEGVAPTNHSSSHKTRLNDLSHGIKIWTDFSSVLSQYTRLTDGQTDGRTDRQTEISSPDRVCIACSAVKIETKILQLNPGFNSLFLNPTLCMFTLNLYSQLFVFVRFQCHVNLDILFSVFQFYFLFFIAILSTITDDDDDDDDVGAGDLPHI